MSKKSNRNSKHKPETKKESVETTDTTTPDKKSRKFSLGWLKGLIGLVVLLGVLIGAGYWLINHENNARVQTESSASPSSTNAQSECYTIPSNTVFTSGYPAWDSILTYAISHPENVEYQKFVKDYMNAGRLDSSNAVYKEILGKVKKEQSANPTLQITPNNELALYDSSKQEYEQVVTEHPEGAYKSGLYVLKVNVYETVGGKKQTREVTIIVGVSQEKGENDIVFSLEKPDNGGTIDGFGVTQILPICK